MLLRVAARRLIEVDSYNETGHRTLMRLFAEVREPAHVKDVYLQPEKRLRYDLGVEPDAATAELFRSLLPEQAANAPVPAERRDISAKTPRLEPVPATRGHPSTAAEDGEQSAIFSGRAGIPRIIILPPIAAGGQDLQHQLAALAHRGRDDRPVPLRSRSQSSLRIRLGVRSKRQEGAPSQFQYRLRRSKRSCKITTVSRGLQCDWSMLQPRHSLGRAIRVQSREHGSAIPRAVGPNRLASRRHDRADRAQQLRCRARPDRLPPVPDRAALLRTLDLPSVRRARRAFKASLSSYPDFVPAISGLAQTFHIEWLLMARGDQDLLSEARHLAAAHSRSTRTTRAAIGSLAYATSTPAGSMKASRPSATGSAATRNMPTFSPTMPTHCSMPATRRRRCKRSTGQSSSIRSDRTITGGRPAV